MNHTILVGLVLLLPLVGAIFNGLGGLAFSGLRRQKGLIGALATLAVAVPFALTLYLFFSYEGEPLLVRFFTWIAAGELELAFQYRIDELSLVMTLIVTGVGALIHLYSIGYMQEDRGYWKYFSYLNLFIFMMLNLVLADNLTLLFLGWEGVGLCSYLLIGFWYEDFKNSEAANKAFIVNRVGDAAFLLAMFLLFREVGSLDFGALLADPAALPPGVVAAAVLLLFIGATGKSAQIPLFVWLPDAMAGPTPVSALIHAATMVTSGLYLFARISPLALAAPGVLVVVALVGALTAFMAATIAITQYDIKKVLAYSTVSQLGYMFMAAGVGAFFVSIFHVLTHAFFKACLFLGSGSVIHAMHHVEHALHKRGHHGHLDPQDMRNMGGLGRFMPATRTTYLIATLAIAGFPLTAGFFSKDEILFKAFEYGYNGYSYAWIAWGLGVVTALLTAFYMMRSYVLTFEGTPRWPMADQVHPHESPTTMTLPLWVLAALSLVGGFIGLPGVIAHGEWNLIHHYLGASGGGPVAEPELHAHVPLAVEWALIGLGIGVALAGLYWSWSAYRRHGLAYDERLRARFGTFYRIWTARYYWDEFYDRVIVQPLLRFARFGLAAFDQKIVDGAVNGVARLMAELGQRVRRVQTGVVQAYAMAIVLGVALVLALMLFG